MWLGEGWLAIDGATFEGNIIGDVEHKTSQYLVYMTAGSYKLLVSCPGYLPLSVNFRDFGLQKVEPKQTYVLTIAQSSGAPVNTDDGMRYLIIKVQPANATVYVDNQLQTTTNGSVSVLLPKGTHTYSVAAPGYGTENGTVDIADSKKTIDVALASVLAQVSVSCPTPGAQIYVNESLKGTSPWSGQLSAGNYQIEARRDGYRPQKQSIALQQRDNKTITFPALTAIVGSLNVNYQPTDAEVWLDGQKIGTSPDVFRNIIVGNHAVELRAKGYATEKKTVTVRENETAQLSGSLTAASASSGSRLTSSSSHAKVPVPEAVDLGLSVKWASFNLGASKPEEYGNYYKWGETTPADDKGVATYKYYHNRIYDKEKKVLKPEHDAATVNLGSHWRMPTKAEIEELVDKCKWEWTTPNGINGIRVTGPNGNAIFLPASGGRLSSGGLLDKFVISGYYWSATPDDGYGRYFYFNSANRAWLLDDPACGYSVRPVLAE